MCQGTVHTFVNALFSVSVLFDRNTHTIHFFHFIYLHKMLPIVLSKEIIKFEKEFKALKNLIEEIENRQASFGACRFLVGVTGLEPATSSSQTDLGRHFPLKIAFSAPFRSENRALRHSYLHCFRVLRNGRWSVMWSTGISAE